MEWNVKNALNRNVEREQLNKILKEIEAAVKSTKTITQADIRRMVEEAVANIASPTLGSFTITLTGDAVGKGVSNNLSNVTIPVTIESKGIEDAPNDSNFYWRGQGDWQAVPAIVQSLATLDVDGLLSYSPELGWYADEAPEDGGQYVRKDGEWVELEVPSAAAIIPMVTGEIFNSQPVFVYLDDGSLVYTEI